MALGLASALGSYEILAPLGAGAMGEVYRALDTRLGREVALKVLPRDLARDPARLARFGREARALAALNHPGIAAIHGLEHADGFHFLVLELVPGTTLAERLLRGPLPVPEAIALGAQVAAALAAAHERGLLHRDVKPANVNVTPDGRAKLLDFGLARAFGGMRAGAISHDALTPTSASTEEGAVHGTAAYMSPEQARGEELDRRSDVWSFGCLLYESLTAERAFPGRTVPDTIAAVLEHEPDWGKLPSSTPAVVRALLRRCLRKDRSQRLHDVADARLELEEALAGEAPEPAASGPGGRRRLVLLGAAGLLAAAVVAVKLLGLGPASGDGGPGAGPVVPRLEVTLPAGTLLPKFMGSSILALSRDGTHLAFVASRRLYVRRLDELEARVVADVNEAPRGPFLSPDGTWVGYESRGKLKLARTDGSSVRTLCDAPSLRGADWSEDGRILFASGEGRLAWISPSGGEPQTVVAPDAARHLLRWPQILPGGRLALATTLGGLFADQDQWRTVLVSLETGELRALLQTPAAAARYLPSGYLVYEQGGTGKGHAAVLEAVRFDLSSLEARGDPVTLLPAVYVAAGSAAPFFAVSDAGLLVYVPGAATPPARRLVWVSREGRVEPASAHADYYSAQRLSPDGTRVALRIGLSQAGDADLWILDLERDTLTRLPSGGEAGPPVWTPDGKHLLFSSGLSGEIRLYRLALDTGEPPVALSSAAVHFPHSVTPDGRQLFFANQSLSAQWDIYSIRLDPHARPRPWLTTPDLEVSAAVSPDGRWVAYRSDESGTAEIYVRPLAGGGPTLAVSRGGGLYPVWSRDGRELYFRELTTQPHVGMMAAALRSAEPLAFDPPRKLFELPEHAHLPWHTWDVASDGRFLMILEDPRESEPLRLVAAPGWGAQLEASLGR